MEFSEYLQLDRMALFFFAAAAELRLSGAIASPL